MDGASAAVGIAAFGIQACQSLLSYYDACKSYHEDIRGTYDAIDDFSRTLVSLKASLENDDLNEEKRERVKRNLQGCEAVLAKLSEKNTKLRKYGQPEGFREKAWAELQRMGYPFRASTLAKLRELVTDARERLKLALQVLDMEVNVTALRTIKIVAGDTAHLVHHTHAIEASVAHVSSQAQQIRDAQLSDRFQKVRDWLSAPDPWTNHSAARQRHEPDTGAWLLQSDKYRRWKAGQLRHLWLYGGAGCGKTVLSSTVIEDIRTLCDSNGTATLVFFYFTFSDDRKQSYENLLRSLILQLAWRDPALSTLLRLCEKPNASRLGLNEMEEIVLASTQAHGRLFLVLDALDECPEKDDAREQMLEHLERLSQGVPQIQLLATSREISEIRESMDSLGAEQAPIATQSVDADIKKYTSTQLSRDRQLRKLDPNMRQLVEETITQKAGGMFRWVYCQLHELKKLRVTKPKYVQAALRALPTTLDETYERMLVGINPFYREEAQTMLRWLAYARSPPTLGELAEASIVNPSGEGTVDFDQRVDLEAALEILSGFVVCGPADGSDEFGDQDGFEDDEEEAEDDEGDDKTADEDGLSNGFDSDQGCGHDSDDRQILRSTSTRRKIGPDSMVRLAHFSVKEYLESTRMRDGAAKEYFLESAAGHRFLAQSCLTYLKHYSMHDEKSSSEEDLREFPLLEYAAKSWFHHSSLQQVSDVSREVELLEPVKMRRDWLLVHRPDQIWEPTFSSLEDLGSGLYYASCLGLRPVVETMLEKGADVHAPGGRYGNALQAASGNGHERAVEILVAKGADVNARGGTFGNALQAASISGYEKIVEMLLAKGADADAGGGIHGSALNAASVNGFEKIIEILFAQGADVNAKRGSYGNALQAASAHGREKVVEILLARGADVNARGGYYGNALQAASYRGNEKVVEILLARGADVNARGGYYENALQAVSASGNERVVEILLAKGADVSVQGGFYGNALQAASAKGHEKIVEILLAHGARQKESRSSSVTSGISLLFGEVEPPDPE